MGPFKTPPFNSLHCSPMLTGPKAGSTKSRWHGKLINDMVCTYIYLGTNFKLKFPSVNDITARIQKLVGNCLLYKIDLQRAFRQLKLDPMDFNKTGLQFMGEYYVDTAVPFSTDTAQCSCRG